MARLVAPAIRKNDNVIVTTGRDRGKRANPQKNVQGGIIEREAAVHASNVQLVCPECGATTRIGRRRLEDGRRVRYCVKCKGAVDK
jgi:large subunit ribosomal protein L24